MYRYIVLDNIRGLAILLVVVSHFFVNKSYRGGELLSSEWFEISYLSNLGLIGVNLFFFLSGFLIFLTIQKQDFFEFILKRIFRIYPVYIFSIVLIFLLYENSFSNLYTYIINMTMYQKIFGIENLNPVFWTLVIEVNFYFFIALMYKIVSFYKIKFLFNYIPFILIFISTIYQGYGIALLNYFPVFFIGIYLYKYLNNEISIFLFLLLFIVISLNMYINLQSYYIEFIISCLLFGMIYYMKEKFSFKWLSFLGKVSYSYYLLHTVIGYEVLYYISNYTNNKYIILFIGLPMTFLIVLFCSYITYLVIEKQFIKLANVLNNLISKKGIIK